MLQMIREESRHLEHLIEDLLYFSNVILKQDELQLEAVDLGIISRQVVELLAPAAKMKQQKLSIDIAAPFPLLYLDRNRTNFVLRALLDNAIKFTPAQGSVLLQGRMENRTVILTISDTGPGIPKEERGKVFSKFYQIDPDFCGQIRGFGLGLFYARQFVRSMNGELTLEDRTDSGTVATVTVPIPS